MKGAGLAPLLGDVSAQRVSAIYEPARVDRFSGDAERFIREISIHVMPTSQYIETRHGGYYVAGSRIGLDGLCRREPSIDFEGHGGVIPDGTADPEVLKLAADAGRVLVSADARTMLVHFTEFIAHNESPGLILIPSSRSFASIIGRAASGVVGLDAGSTEKSSALVTARKERE